MHLGATWRSALPATGFLREITHSVQGNAETSCGIIAIFDCLLLTETEHVGALIQIAQDSRFERCKHLKRFVALNIFVLV